MICEHCGHSMPDGSLTCDSCGAYLGGYASNAGQTSGVRGIRQGRVSTASPTLPSGSEKVKEYGDYELSSLPVENEDRIPRRRPVASYQTERGSSRPDTRRGVPVNAYGRAPTVKNRHGRVHPVKGRGVNWMLIGVIIVTVVVIAAGGLYVYMRRSSSGQRARARSNTLSATEAMFTLAENTKDPLVQEEREALLKKWSGVNEQFYWLVGQDYLDVGEVELAITSFRIADILDPDNYDGLLLLASAYELNLQADLAEELYLKLATEISTFRTEAYTALISMYQEQGRGPEAADMMLLAYNNTDKETFRLQRKDYIPESPQVNLTAGRYEINKMESDIQLTSPQGYDIYYTVDDDAVLPDDGILTTDGTITPKEGSVKLRAVCVSGDLVSDPISVSYTFYYPTPPAPKASLAPNTYKKIYSVSLRPGEMTDMTKAEAEEAAAQLTYYYTIDGSTPTTESPIYDGTPIQMPSGRVTLRAVCVNQYGKMSSTLEVGYKFDVKPGPLEVYKEADTFSGFVLNKTELSDFTATFGQPQETLPTTYLNLSAEAQHLVYSWGYAVFVLEDSKWVLVRVEMEREITSGPRSVGFSSTEEEITGVYKDFGQVQSPNGTRGLYYDYPSVGQVLVNDDGTRTVQYSCQTAASKIWVLQYHLNASGRVDKITHYYQP